MKNLIIQSDFGKDFNKMCKEAKVLAIQNRNNGRNQNVQFEFNGIDCIVSPDTNLEHLFRDYHTAFTMDWKTIGPDCAVEYSDKIVRELKRRTIKKEKEAEERNKKYRLEAEKKEKDLKRKISKVKFECSDDENFSGWDKSNKDPYGGRIVSYAKEWAMLMQVEMAKGEKLKDIAQRTSSEADYDGITGFMYGAAVQMLSQCWRHGEELRKWHNKEYDHEGDGVVNPAMLTINTK